MEAIADMISDWVLAQYAPLENDTDKKNRSNTKKNQSQSAITGSLGLL